MSAEPQLSEVAQAPEAKNDRPKGPGQGWVWAIVIGGVVVSLILSCVVGAAAGFIAGRFASRTSTGWLTPYFGQQPSLVPMPEAPRIRPLQTPQPDLVPNLLGVAVVREVTPNSPAEKAGLQAGDIITRVDNVRLNADHRLADVIATYQPGDTVTLTLRSAGQQRNTLTVTLGAHPDDAQRAYLGIRYTDMEIPDLPSNND